MSERSLEKPLHVQVAEALGCKPAFVKHGPSSHYDRWECTCPSDGHWWWEHGSESHGCYLPRLADYPTNWSATGPLVEKYGIGFIWDTNHIPVENRTWIAGIGWAYAYEFEPTTKAEGATPLLAICHLILALAKEGKLNV